MLSQTYIGKKANYTISKKLGEGGEGAVYELANSASLVLKIYSEPLTATKIDKLNLMMSMPAVQIKMYAAWPEDVVVDANKKVCGFVMKKLANYVPLHELFSPMNRKKLFPDKGYNFLVHVARNLSMAFHIFHSIGLIIGDVNEGNILVNNQGMVAFIDCDSFQIKESDRFYFCDVGVPRYTPPELLGKETFQNVIRTMNTDIFSMAVLIFQLLFLGRHPFAGKNNTKEDIDEETAIKNQWFAFSLKNKLNKLAPPSDSYNIHNITDGLILLFHNTFEHVANRPAPSNWIKELEHYTKELVQCSNSKMHTFPSKLSKCPWCEFKEQRNILYFLDDDYLKQIGTLTNIEEFVNGFKIERLKFSRIEFPANPGLLNENPIDRKYKLFKWYQKLTVALPVILGIGLCVVSGWYFIGGIFSAIMLNNLLPWGKKIKQELNRRDILMTSVKQKLETAIKEFNYPNDFNTYINTSDRIEQLIQQFRNLPQTLQEKRRAMEEKMYKEQLHKFLITFDIRYYAIPSFGSSRKLSLYTAGIRTASDITRLNTVKIQGIGPKFIQTLLSWQRQMSSKFIYHPDNSLIHKEYNLILSEINQTKRYLEVEIKKDYQALQYLKLNISNRQTQLQKSIEVLKKQYFQADLDYKEFKKIAA